MCHGKLSDRLVTCNIYSVYAHFSLPISYTNTSKTGLFCPFAKKFLQI